MEDLLRRITVDERVLRGKPTIRGLRISVEQVLRALAAGIPEQEILEDYPDLEPDDLRAAEAYAAECIGSECIYPIRAGRPVA
jgi:uncharacterized protein (DUF433 family)